MLDQAIAFAATAHAGQKRKYTGDPYIVHPIEVMSIINRFGGTDEMLVAAVLHDVLEDTVVTERELERRFGNLVTALVVGLTEVRVDGNRATRKEAERMRLAAQPAMVQTIKCADILSNTSSIMDHDPKFAKVYVQEARLLLMAMDKASEPIRTAAMAGLP